MDKRRAKIVATIGPASQDERTLQALIQAGMNVARLNFSHGKHSDHEEVVKRIRAISHRLGYSVGIMQDLQGPKIRTGKLKEPVTLTEDAQIILTTNPGADGTDKIPVDFYDLPHVVTAGRRILLDDGNLELEVVKIENNDITARVVLGGLLKSNKGINLPGTHLTIPGFTQKDEEDLAFGLKIGVDAVAISFVRTPQDVARVRQAISRMAPDKIDTPIIAKLERPEALDNLSEIVDLADGVMVARGDLGVEMPTEIVPIAQKRIIDEANHKSKIVITATQMLESMINNPRPTRAEASDVANAVFDGTDAVMLSAETASGKYPVKTVEIMDRIVREAEDHTTRWGHWQGTASESGGDDASSITRAARELAHDLNVAAIVVFTQSGRTARLMAKAQPRVPILGFTPVERAYNRMAMYWGVYPYMVPYVTTLEEMLTHVDTAMIASTPIKPGQQVVVISGFPVGAMRLPNLAMLYTVGQRS
jgi:pyruvate kinase